MRSWKVSIDFIGASLHVRTACLMHDSIIISFDIILHNGTERVSSTTSLQLSTFTLSFMLQSTLVVTTTRASMARRDVTALITNSSTLSWNSYSCIANRHSFGCTKNSSHATLHFKSVSISTPFDNQKKAFECRLQDLIRNVPFTVL